MYVQSQDIPGIDGGGGEFPRVGPGAYDVAGLTRDRYTCLLQCVAVRYNMVLIV